MKSDAGVKLPEHALYANGRKRLTSPRFTIGRWPDGETLPLSDPANRGYLKTLAESVEQAQKNVIEADRPAKVRDESIRGQRVLQRSIDKTEFQRATSPKTGAASSPSLLAANSGVKRTSSPNTVAPWYYDRFAASRIPLGA